MGKLKILFSITIKEGEFDFSVGGAGPVGNKSGLQRKSACKLGRKNTPPAKRG